MLIWDTFVEDNSCHTIEIQAERLDVRDFITHLREGVLTATILKSSSDSHRCVIVEASRCGHHLRSYVTLARSAFPRAWKSIRDVEPTCSCVVHTVILRFPGTLKQLPIQCDTSLVCASRAHQSSFQGTIHWLWSAVANTDSYFKRFLAAVVSKWDDLILRLSVQYTTWSTHTRLTAAARTSILISDTLEIRSRSFIYFLQRFNCYGSASARDVGRTWRMACSYAKWKRGVSSAFLSIAADEDLVAVFIIPVRVLMLPAIYQRRSSLRSHCIAALNLVTASPTLKQLDTTTTTAPGRLE